MEINDILYDFSEIIPYLCTIVPIVVSLLIFLQKDIMLKNKVLIAILVIIFFAFLFFYTKNLIEMPKVVDDLYSDAIQTLNEHELKHRLSNKNEEDIYDTKDWRVTYQSIPEGSIIKKRTEVSLEVDKINEDDSKSEDNSITSNGDNTINIQNHEGGIININNYNTDQITDETINTDCLPDIDVFITTSNETTAIEYMETFPETELFPQMPMLLSLKENEATQIITELNDFYNLELEIEVYPEGDYEYEDELIVIDQIPSNGEILERGTTVQLTVISLYNIDNSEYDSIPIIDPFIDDIEDIVSGNYYRIKHIESGKYLDVKDGSIDNGTIIQIWEYYPDNYNQIFTIIDIGDGKYLLVASHSGKVIELRNDGLNDRDPVAQWEYDELSCQQWYIEQNGDGTFSFKNVNSGLYLNVEGNYTENGSRLIQYHDDNTTANKFYIEIA